MIGAKLMGDSSTLIKVVNNQIEHNVATSNGTSGSPIYIKLSKEGSKEEYYCIGLHSAVGK